MTEVEPGPATISATEAMVIVAMRAWLAEDCVRAVVGAVEGREARVRVAPLPAWVRGAARFLCARGRDAALRDSVAPLELDDVLAEQPLARMSVMIGCALRRRKHEKMGRPLTEEALARIVGTLAVPPGAGSAEVFYNRALALGRAELLLAHMLAKHRTLERRRRGRRELLDFGAFLEGVRQDRGPVCTDDVVAQWCAITDERANRAALRARWSRYLAKDSARRAGEVGR